MGDRLSALCAGEKDSRADHQHGQGNSPCEPEKRIGEACAHGHRLHRVAARGRRYVLQHAFAFGADVARDFRLYVFGTDALANFARGVGYARFELIYRLGQTCARLFGLAL